MSIVTRLTAEEFVHGDLPRNTELLFGEVIVTDPTLLHQRVMKCLLYALEQWVRSGRDRGEVGFGGNWVLGPDTVLVPDLWWITSDRQGELSLLWHDTVPDLAVEVRSPGTWRYDVGPKRTLYEQSGVAELWLVDPPGEAVLVNRRSKGSATFDQLLEVPIAGLLTSPLLPDFSITVAELLADPTRS